MNLSLKLAGFFLIVVVCSCRRNRPIDPGEPNPPDTTIVTHPLAPPPSSIEFENRYNTTLKLDFDYSVPNTIDVKLDGNTAVHYLYNNGYLQQVEYFDGSGNTAGKFTVERVGNTVNRVIMEHVDPVTSIKDWDTLAVAFTGLPGQSDMTVNGKYFTDVPITVKYTYQDSLVRKIDGGEFEASVFLPSYQFTYDEKKRLALKTTDSYYGTSYAYGDVAGSGLDSLYLVLGGKDGYLLEGLLFYDEYLSVFFYPLQIILEDVGIELDALIHRYGALREVRTVPNGSDYTEIKVFTIQNTFDDKKRVITSRIFRGSEYYANYSIAY
ncbi:MAG: hypothetical protein KIT80_11990 [Chitinophagaceae bacterium]|nr:hypothetical protein [Chitinophagaceae bacterium]MCW5927623.1 hypothetical protein [Chitinophagaceae bacterium]